VEAEEGGEEGGKLVEGCATGRCLDDEVERSAEGGGQSDLGRSEGVKGSSKSRGQAARFEERASPQAHTTREVMAAWGRATLRPREKKVQIEVVRRSESGERHGDYEKAVL